MSRPLASTTRAKPLFDAGPIVRAAVVDAVSGSSTRARMCGTR